MADEQLNIRPRFRTTEIPCEGEVGDIVIVSPLDERDVDPVTPGSVQVYICTRASNAEMGPALWCRLRFDCYVTCKRPLPKPFIDIPLQSGG